MPTNMPGNKIIPGMGGYCNVISPYNGTMIRLDVAQWRIHRDIRTFHKGHSGTLGAIATRITGLDWTASMRIWWDVGNPPETLLLSGYGCGIQFGMGSLAGQQSYGITAQQFYLAPSCILKTFDVMDSSEGNDDDVVTAEATVQGNSLLFQLPQELADYNVYVNQLQSLGQFQALGTFTTMQ